MSSILFLVGTAFCILALAGLIGVLVFLASAALKLKTSVIDNARRLYKRPLAAGRNLTITVKGIAQQETVRGKHIGTSAKVAVLAVKDAASHIKDAVQSVHPGEMKPALSYASNLSNVFKVALKLSQVGTRQRAEK